MKLSVLPVDANHASTPPLSGGVLAWLASTGDWCWHGYLSGAKCRLAYIAQLMPLSLTVSCFSKIQTGFTFLVPAHPGSPGQEAVKRMCVLLVDVFTLLCVCFHL